MNHIDLLKQAFNITWRFRALWVFGFFLALCSGGGGGGSFSPPTGSDFDPADVMPDVDMQMVLTISAVVVCLVLLVIVLSIVIRAVTQTALIGMVRQAEDTDQVTVRDGWQFGWSRRAWRLFLVGIVIGIPVAIFTIVLFLLALSPLLLLISGEEVFMAIGIILSVLAFLFVLLLIVLLSAVLTPLFELSYRHVVFRELGIIDTIRYTVRLVRKRLKDVAIIWLLMLGIGIVWGIVAFIVVLPLALIAALIIGGLPAALVYLVSQSWIGAAIAGIPLAFIAIMLVSSFFAGIYQVYHSSVWTLAYLNLQEPDVKVIIEANPAAEPPVPDEGLQPAS